MTQISDVFAGFKLFAFQSAVDRMRGAYRTSLAAMEQAYVQAKQASDSYEASGEDDSEYDEDNILVHSTRHSLDHEAMNAGLAVAVIREAFVTSVFHFWEASARDWTDLKSGQSFAELYKKYAAIFVDNPEITRLNTLNNYIKHRNPKREAELLAMDQQYLVPNVFHKEGLTNLRLRLTDAHVEEAFEIVWNSGPIRRSETSTTR